MYVCTMYVYTYIQRFVNCVGRRKLGPFLYLDIKFSGFWKQRRTWADGGNWESLRAEESGQNVGGPVCENQFRRQITCHFHELAFWSFFPRWRKLGHSHDAVSVPILETLAHSPFPSIMLKLLERVPRAPAPSLLMTNDN
jgi:hypothetical protein